MTTVAATEAPQTLDGLVLVRLLVPATAAKARGDVGKIAAGQEPGEWAITFATVWARLTEHGLIGPPPGKRAGKTFALTEAGRHRVLAFLQVAELPAKPTWAALQADYLLPLAMSLRPGSPESRRLKTAPQIKLALIGKARQVPLRDGASAKAVLAALAWKLIGIESEADFTAETVIQRLAPDRLPSKKLTAAQLTTALAAVAVGSSRTTVADLRLGAIRRWLLTPPTGASDSAVAPETGLERFAVRVMDAARSCSPPGRFGDNKVFISHVWRQMRGEPSIGLDEFKRHLVAANRDGLLQLSRADLVEAMDSGDVRESSTVYGNATFHFVRI
ncbi:MAG TPA: hypothetical protein VHC22_25790 [Pirellulales bacterium]|nr:hypothetical protein [Pirellulales bacterium]